MKCVVSGIPFNDGRAFRDIRMPDGSFIRAMNQAVFDRAVKAVKVSREIGVKRILIAAGGVAKSRDDSAALVPQIFQTDAD